MFVKYFLVDLWHKSISNVNYKLSIMPKRFLQTFSTFIIFFISSNKLVAQTLVQDSIRVDKKNKTITVPYNLKNGEIINVYNIDVYYSGDRGKTFLGPIKTAKGHIGKDILAGDNRQILWQYGEEDKEFKGKDVQFKLVADYETSVFNYKNENALWRSVLLPGWGNPYVREYKNFKWKYRWLITTVAVYGLIGGSFAQQNAADKTYNTYLNANNNGDATKFYSDANQKYQIAQGMAILAGAIWATDIVRVGLKGRKNRIEKNRLLQKNKKMDADVGIQLAQTRLGQYSPVFSFSVKF